jgi:membrane-associated protease RseP (regulator of RpoE activity)
MVNFDMIGWLRENRLTLYNGKTSPQFAPIFEEANSGFDFDLKVAVGGGSDQIPFNQKEIPNMFIHTGQNEVYHTPEDDFEAINCEGALKVIDFSERVVDGLAALPKRPTYGTPRPPRLGVMIDDANGTVVIEGVTSGSIAEKAGLKEGDVVLEVDDVAITKRREVNQMVRRDAGKTVKMKLKRGDDEILLNVELKK